MHKKFEINHTKIKGGCQSGRKVVTHDSKSDFPLIVGTLNCKSYITYSRYASYALSGHLLSKTEYAA